MPHAPKIIPALAPASGDCVMCPAVGTRRNKELEAAAPVESLGESGKSSLGKPDEVNKYNHLRDAAREKYSRVRRSCISEVADPSSLA